MLYIPITPWVGRVKFDIGLDGILFILGLYQHVVFEEREIRQEWATMAIIVEAIGGDLVSRLIDTLFVIQWWSSRFDICTDMLSQPPDIDLYEIVVWGVVVG